LARRVSHFRQEYAEQKRVLTRTLTRLGELKTHDPLTGLTDHHHMQELLRAECKRHSRNAMTFSLAMLSIDQLQQVHTRYGAAQGDMVIRQLGQLAAQHLRTSDVVARWSSQEFLILMPETDLNGAYRSVERLREFLSTRWGFYSEGKWVPMDCTVGVTHFRAADNMPVLLQRVEQALTDARRLLTQRTQGDQA
jgi:diguanylate cyclase (GGDEF)-like protein